MIAGCCGQGQRALVQCILGYYRHELARAVCLVLLSNANQSAAAVHPFSQSQFVRGREEIFSCYMSSGFPDWSQQCSAGQASDGRRERNANDTIIILLKLHEATFLCKIPADLSALITTWCFSCERENLPVPKIKMMEDVLLWWNVGLKCNHLKGDLHGKWKIRNLWPGQRKLDLRMTTTDSSLSSALRVYI